MGVSIMQQGIVKSDLFSEGIIRSPFDQNIYIEPDGSTWIRIFHHNNPNGGVFSSSDTFDTQVYKDENRWFNISLCNNQANNWELMIKQKATATSTETKYRWIQTVNPMTATYAQVAQANITRNTSSGYSTYGTYGGIYHKVNDSKTYMACNDGSSASNFWCAIGSFITYQGGIPGYAQVVVTTGYIDLYLRVPDNVNCSFGQNYIITNELIEI